MNLIIPMTATILSVLVGFYIGKQNNCNCNPKKDVVIQFPKFKKEDPIIYEEKETEEKARANHFYQ